MSRSVLRIVSKIGSFSAIRPRINTPLLSRYGTTVYNLHTNPLFTSASRHYSSQVDRKFTEVLTNEIRQEKEQLLSCPPPKGFSVAKSEGTEITLVREYPDGVTVEVQINLAGSINPDMEEEEDVGNPEKKDECPTLEAHPDIRIRLQKPSGRSVVFTCSLPSRDTRQQLSSEGDDNLPTYSVDSVEMGGMPDYFVYTDLFDDSMYDHTMQLLMERKLDAQFQNELQEFCTAEEHKMYLKFLDEFHAYCRD
ncbi:unnamed protein product [Calicophoron daubneyi]|uniref:Complement component 1 Q subcomponent-binding protein, mitochondrial n=1 Tax=Calicophoron daubneyi TaxID=300641 RepID=A0AAV2THZ7_CALDB